MKKKLLILAVILAILLGLYFIDNYFNFNYLSRPELNKGYENLQTGTSVFRGPNGAPSVKGPSGPPPGTSY